MTVGAGSVRFPLVGRADAEDLLWTVLAAVADRSGDCVVVEGPAGIGKSRMLAEVAARAEGLGIAVAAGCASEVDRIAPFSTRKGSTSSICGLSGGGVVTRMGV